MKAHSFQRAFAASRPALQASGDRGVVNARSTPHFWMRSRTAPRVIPSHRPQSPRFPDRPSGEVYVPGLFAAARAKRSSKLANGLTRAIRFDRGEGQRDDSLRRSSRINALRSALTLSPEWPTSARARSANSAESRFTRKCGNSKRNACSACRRCTTHTQNRRGERTLALRSLTEPPNVSARNWTGRESVLPTCSVTPPLTAIAMVPSPSMKPAIQARSVSAIVFIDQRQSVARRRAPIYYTEVR